MRLTSDQYIDRFVSSEVYLFHVSIRFGCFENNIKRQQ